MKLPFMRYNLCANKVSNSYILLLLCPLDLDSIHFETSGYPNNLYQTKSTKAIKKVSESET